MTANWRNITVIAAVVAMYSIVAANWDWGTIAEVITAVATMAAVLVAISTIWEKREDDRRANRLNRINQQLSQFYGKLFILYETGMRNWCSFIEQHGNDSKIRPREFVRFFPDTENEDSLPPPTAEQLKVYRRWLTTLFIKTNEKMLEVIYANADLVIGKNRPDVLIHFAQHVASMRLLQITLEEEERKEKSGAKSKILNDWREYVKIIAPYPDNIGHYIVACFEVLKGEQEKLLSTPEPPLTEVQIAQEIKKVQDGKAEYWNKEELIVRAARAQSYRPQPRPKRKWWRRLLKRG
ncbi:hypothetical protein [Hymenobacter profundi]|uniref:DUF4760 domain-containing protein n=1 Tax=Hymenobacter profundi TaxID=1982110 RepID=A0ABS6X2G1_9BACT|nr:hypothetical protein [Hymenobacter profundi]MBW3130012.1 hypothetical protein [Hymenobacter profundi]